jgi:hypothetical protein
MYANCPKLRDTFNSIKKAIDVRSRNTSWTLAVSGGDMLYLLQIDIKLS